MCANTKRYIFRKEFSIIVLTAWFAYLLPNRMTIQRNVLSTRQHIGNFCGSLRRKKQNSENIASEMSTVKVRDSVWKMFANVRETLFNRRSLVFRGCQVHTKNSVLKWPVHLLLVVSTLALPGESCRKGFCVGGSVCTNFICKCPGDYFKQGDSCVRYESRIGAPCGMSTGCSGGSQCSSSYCQCMDQYDADMDECYPQEAPVRSKNIKSISGRRKVNRVVNAAAVNCPIGYDLVNGMCVNSETLSVIQLCECLNF